MNKSPMIKNYEIVKAVSPSMRYKSGESFDEWKKEAKKKLYTLLGMDRFTQCSPDFNLEYVKDEGEFTEYRFTMRSEENYYFPAVMRVPAGVEGKMPLIVCLQGHSTGFHISLGVPKFEGDQNTISGGDRDFAVRAVKEGFIALCIEQRNFGECSGKEEPGTNCFQSSMRALLTGRTTIGERVWDIQRCLDVVLERFDFIDTARIMCMGNSGGGTATIYAACLEERFSLAMPSCAVCTYKHSIAAMHHCACNYIPDIANYFDMGDLCAMVAPRKLVIVNGAQDTGFLKEGVDECYEVAKAGYAAAGVKDYCRLVTGAQGHRFYADLSWPVLHELEKI